ncbi:MAG: hypothetical protein J0M15_16325 [Deltaproteobacteria bacterium]|nr:hypothetical protein [Deltaproteobacteria bacterium]
MKLSGLLFFFWVCAVFSVTIAAPKRDSSRSKKIWDWELRLNTLASLSYQKYHADEFNFLNQILKKPETSLQLEFQPTFDLKFRRLPLKWLVKPLFKARFSTYLISSENKSTTITDYGFWENYLTIELAQQLEASAGIINLQWGPSELVNPSQFLLTQQTLTTEPYQFFQGIEIAQILWTPLQNVTLNLVKELKPFEWEHTDELAGYRPRNFFDRTLLRGEYSSDNGALTVGQVIGAKNSDRWRWQYGGYALWNYTDWTQLYTDYMTQAGSEVDYWDGTQLVRHYDESNYVFFLGVLGHRLTFDNGMEWKIEWISNSFGKSKNELTTEHTTLKQNPFQPLALMAYYQRYYIFPGQNYVYNSLRWDNPIFLSSLFSTSTLFLRDLVSLSDSSHFVNFEFQSSLSDNWSHAFALIKTLGEPEGELNAQLNMYGSYVIKRSF